MPNCAGWDFADDADFFAAHLSPITIYWKKSGKLLIAIGIACATDGLKKEFIPHASLTILLMLLSKKAFLRLKLASFAFEVSFISNWFEA